MSVETALRWLLTTSLSNFFRLQANNLPEHGGGSVRPDERVRRARRMTLSTTNATTADDPIPEPRVSPAVYPTRHFTADKQRQFLEERQLRKEDIQPAGAMRLRVKRLRVSRRCRSSRSLLYHSGMRVWSDPFASKNDPKAKEHP